MLSESCGELRRGPGTLPFRFAQGRVADEGVHPYTNTFNRTRGGVARLLQELRLFLQVDVLDVLDGQAQESLSQAAKLFGRVGREEFQARRGTAFLRGGR